MGRDSRVREAMERQLRERMNLQRGKMYDKFGREVQVGNLVLIPGGYHGEWTVQKIRPSSGLTGSDLPANSVEVVIGSVQRFVLPDATLIGDLLQVLDRQLGQPEAEQAGQEGSSEKQPAEAPQEPGEAPKILEFGK